jgi:hypothetical protein
MRYRKKPVVIEAMQWPGYEGQPFDSWLTKDEHHTVALGEFDEFDQAPLLIPTLEGTMQANPGDWVIRGVNGELYPCKPDIFKATYESVETTA